MRSFTFQPPFARNRHEAMFPCLWDGIMSAWAPCRGITGAELKNYGRRSSTGVLTNMSISTDWVRSDGRLALDFATDNFVNCGDSNQLNGETRFTLSLWVYPRSVASRQILLHKFAAGQGYSLEINSTDLRSFVAQDGSDGGGNFIAGAHGMSASTRWYHVSMVYQGAATEFTVDGSPISASITGSLTAAVVDGAQALCAGATAAASLPLDGQLDDIRIYRRSLTLAERWLLSRERGIAYRRRDSDFEFADDDAATARRLGVIGGGVYYSGAA